MKEKNAAVKLSDVNAVTSCAAFAAFDLNLCRALVQVAKDSSPATLQPTEHAVPSRRLIYHKRDLIEGVPIICRGWAASAVTLSDGRRQILSFLLPGDPISTDLVFQPVSHCSVEAITDVRYRIFKRTEFKAALLNHPSLLDKLSKIWSEETAQANQLAVDLGRRTADERIARLVLNLLDRLTRRGLARDRVMDFPLRQHHVADATGLTVVHVGKVLSEFRRAGLLDIKDRSLAILDLPGLHRVADMR